jgi:ketosteroid isomerase-like protein
MSLSAENLVFINALYSRYNASIDTGDGDAFAACFTPDGRLDSGRSNEDGTAAISAFASATHETLPGLRHLASNIVIDGDGDTATGSAFLLAFNIAAGFQPLATGRYSDRLTKTADGWRFASRAFTAD